MRKKAIGLASSWETLRDIQVDVESTPLVDATARIGFKPKRGGETIFPTETYRLPSEKGMWKIGLQKILQTKIGFLPDLSGEESRAIRGYRIFR